MKKVSFIIFIIWCALFIPLSLILFIAGEMYPQTLIFENASPIRITVVNFVSVFFRLMPILIVFAVGFSMYLRKTEKYKLSLILQIIPFVLITIIIIFDALIY